MGIRVVAAKHHQKIDNGLLKAFNILFIVRTVFILVLLKDLTCFGYYEFRLIKGTGIIGTQINNDGIRFPGIEIVGLAGS